MPSNDAFDHNGISINKVLAPPPMGPLGKHVFGLVGTAPDADPLLPKNSPIRMANLADAAKLDLAGNETGTLWRTLYEIFRIIAVPCYVIIVDEGATPADTQNNIIGGVDGGTGARTGIQALADCLEDPTHICAPGFGAKPVSDALAAMASRLFAVAIGDGPDTNDTAAVTFSGTLGGEAYDNYYLVDPQVLVYSKAAKGNVFFSGAAMAMIAFAGVKIWESPEVFGPVPTVQGTSRSIDYKIMDKSTNGGLLNKNGIGYFAHTSMGGFKVKGHRTVTGRFVSQVGLEHALVRKLAAVAEPKMGKNLSRTFIESEINRLNTWLRSLQADETIIGANVYLHPTLNNTANYSNGEWHIAISYADFAPNEHMVYHLSKDEGILNAYLESF